MAASRTDYVPVECVVLVTTDAAIKIGVDSGEYWIPRSLCDDPDGISVDDEEVSIQRWKVEELGLND